MPDNLLVNRNGQTYQVDLENTAMIEDTDLLLVNRNGTTYTVAGDQISRGDFSEVIISPLAITPETSEQIITATADIPKVGSSVPADVFWTWYLYDEATGDAGKTAVQSTTNREITDTYILPASAAGKFVGCSVEYLAVTIDETQRCAVGTPDGPVADMNGLRFDRDRLTRFTRNTNGTIGTTFTFSTWVKPSTIREPNRLFTIYNIGGSTYSMARIRPDLRIQCYLNTDGSSQLDTTATLDANSWNHLVITVDAGKWTVVINGGTPQVMGTSTNANNDGATFGVGGFEQSGNGNECIDGYLSDYYFVDGLALEPTAFGKEFPEGWGPLDSSQVEANITASKVQPYDTRPNMEDDWSSYYVSQNSESGKAFDGNLTTFAAPNPSSNLEWNYTINSGTLRVLIGINLNGPDLGFRVTDANGTIGLDLSGIANDSSGWIDLTDLVTFPVTKFQWFRAGAGSAGTTLGAVEIDGRILVDGPADNSQVWSGGQQEGTLHASSDWSTAFNGIGGSANQVIAADSAAAKLTFPEVATGGQVTVKGIIQSGAFIRLYFGDGSTAFVSGLPTSGDATSDPIVISTLGGLAGIESISSGSNRGAIYQVLIDDEPLVDGEYQWDTSQVWSVNTSANPVDPAGQDFTKIFDGSTSTGIVYSEFGTTQITFSPAITGSKIEIYADNLAADNSIAISGGATITSNGWSDTDVTSLAAIPLSRLSGKPQQVIRAIRVDGVILVDAGDFGTDGFYLPFDPTAGQIWSDGGSGDAAAGYPWTKAFDGEISGSAVNVTAMPVSTADGGSGEMTWTGSVDTTGKTVTLYYWYQTLNDAANYIEVNGTKATLVASGGSSTAIQALDVSSLAGNQLTQLKIVRGVGASHATGIAGIAIDGVLLVDHSAIGTDASGQGNHFEDKNFSTDPFKVIPATDWVSKVSGPSRSGFEPSNAFDGNTGTGWAPAVSNAQTFTPNGATGLEFTTLAVYGYVDTGANNVLSVNGVDVTDKFREGPSAGTIRRSVLSDVAGVTSPLVNLVSTSQGSASNALITAIEIDGAILLNNQASVSPTQDTVLDTPLFNYAVLDSSTKGVNATLANGNLDWSTTQTTDFMAQSTLSMSSGKYYCEFIADSAANNIGLQRTAGTLSTLYCGGNADSWAYEGAGGNKRTNNVGVAYGDAYDAGDVVSIAFDADAGELEFYKNGVPQGVAYTGLTNGPYSFALGNGANQAGVFNFGQQPFVHATDNGNGTVNFIDISPNRSQKWSDLLSIAGVDPTLAFDGDESTRGRGIATTTGGQVSWQLDTTISSVTSLRVRLVAGSNNESVVLNGSTTPVFQDHGNTADWTSIPESVLSSIGNQVTSIAVTANSGSTVSIYAVEVNGRILVDGPADTSQVWSDAPSTASGGFNATKPAVNAFDGTLSTFAGSASNSSTEGGVSLSFDFSSFNLSVTSNVRVYFVAGTGLNNRKAQVNGGTFVQSNSSGYADIPFSGTLGIVNSTLGSSSPINAGATIAAIEVDGKILVDGQDLGPYNKLYQTWSQWVVQTLRLELAEADALRSMLKSHAQTYSAGTDYCEGSVIKAFGELWIAIGDAPATTFADLPAIMTHPNWEQLNISIN